MQSASLPVALRTALQPPALNLKWLVLDSSCLLRLSKVLAERRWAGSLCRLAEAALVCYQEGPVQDCLWLVGHGLLICLWLCVADVPRHSDCSVLESLKHIEAERLV